MAATDTTLRNGFALRLGRFTLPWPVLVLGAVVALFVLFNYPGFALLMERWNSDSNYGHGYLIPFIAGYFVWTKKEELLKLEGGASLWGLALFLAGLPLRFLALPLASAVVAGWGIVIMTNGLVLYLGGRRVYRALWLPAVYLAFMVPLPQSWYNALAEPLQQFASTVSAAVLDGLLGIPTIQKGNIIELAGHTLQVAEACSGMRSIMGLLALGVAFAYFWERAMWERIFLVASTVPIAILANICRVTGTGVLYHKGYQQYALGFYHEFTGWFVFIFAMTLFLFEAWLMDRLFVHDRARPA
jgi:exosortase